MRNDSRSRLLPYFLTGMVLLCVAAFGQSTPQPPPTTPGCSGITVDVYGGQESNDYRYFLIQVQTAVKSDDRKQLSTMVQYPLLWSHDGVLESVRNSKDLLNRYDAIFSPNVRGQILRQNIKCLPATDMSAQVGNNGEVQFTRTGSGPIKIITITAPRATQQQAALHAGGR